MVTNISNFCTSIICTIMMVIILEMLVPEGKNKKYILFVCGIIVTLILFEPILNLLNINIEQVFSESMFKYEELKYDESLYEKSIRETYEETLINDIVNRLKENGYSVSNVRVEYDNVTLQPSKIYMNLEGEAGYIQPVKIEVHSQNSNIIENQIMKNKIKNIITENYGVKRDNIYID